MAKAKKPKKEPMGFVCYLLSEDGTAIPFEELTPEQKAAWQQAAAARLSETMSDYYTQHPEEYWALIKADPGRTIPT